MKFIRKTIQFLIIAILTGCTCLGQIPPQTIYVDQNCEAQLPDYTLIATVSDNCEGATISQDPPPGTVLDFANPALNVTVTAEDAFGNQDQVTFEVLALDTIPPILSFPESFYAMNQSTAGALAAHKTFNSWVQYNLCEWRDADYTANPYFAQYDSLGWLEFTGKMNIEYDIEISDSLYSVYLNNK